MHYIDSDVAMFEDQIVPEINYSSCLHLDVPVQWQLQSQCVELFDVLPQSQEWNQCEQMVLKSLRVTITQIQRIQNKWLWEAYSFNRTRMLRRNGTIVEMDLFHGTGSNDPAKIVCGEDGLDVRLSRVGRWGRAIYLSECAQYTDRFAHTTASGQKQM